MADYNRGFNRNQLSFDLNNIGGMDHMIPHDHFIRYIDKFCDLLDYDDLGFKMKATGGAGNRPIHPSIALKIWLVAYNLRIYSSRPVVEACKYDDRFRFVANGLTLNKTFLCWFRSANAEAISKVFYVYNQFAANKGLLNAPKKAATDGSKLRANASKDTIFSKSKINEIIKGHEEAIKEIIGMIKKGEEIDAFEDLEERVAALENEEAELSEKIKNFKKKTELP